MRDICFWQNRSILGSMALYYTFKEMQRARHRTLLQDYHFLAGPKALRPRRPWNKETRSFLPTLPWYKAPDSMMYNSLGTALTPSTISSCVLPVEKIQDYLQIPRFLTTRSPVPHRHGNFACPQPRIRRRKGYGRTYHHCRHGTTAGRERCVRHPENVRDRTMGYYISPQKLYDRLAGCAKQWGIQKIRSQILHRHQRLDADRYRVQLPPRSADVVAVIAAILLIVRKGTYNEALRSEELETKRNSFPWRTASRSIPTKATATSIISIRHSHKGQRIALKNRSWKRSVHGFILTTKGISRSHETDDLMKNHRLESMIGLPRASFAWRAPIPGGIWDIPIRKKERCSTGHASASMMWRRRSNNWFRRNIKNRRNRTGWKNRCSWPIWSRNPYAAQRHRRFSKPHHRTTQRSSRRYATILQRSQHQLQPAAGTDQRHPRPVAYYGIQARWISAL